MVWVICALGAALAWGMYGPSLHAGQVALGSPFRALLCVGLAYLAIGVIVPVVALSAQGTLTTGWSTSGAIGATAAGALGAIGAVFIIYAFRNGGAPAYVMPLVFGGAPVVNVLVTMYMHPPRVSPHPLLWVGFVLVAVGASLVLYYKPQA